MVAGSWKNGGCLNEGLKFGLPRSVLMCSRAIFSFHLLLVILICFASKKTSHQLSAEMTTSLDAI